MTSQDDVAWFHGGVPGLEVGEWLAPPDVSGTDHRLSRYAAGQDHGTRTDVVYLTPRQQVARAFAAMYPDGALYRVAPEGPLAPDPDAPDVAVMCGRAQVLEVVQPIVVFAHRKPESWLAMLRR